jgi:prepilin-type N-terminal cleavage/methylation domain-containing protein
MLNNRRYFITKLSSSAPLTSCIGYSLIELMVVLSVIALTVLATVPSYKSMLEQYRLNRSLELWHNALQLAKTSAYTGRKQTIICPLQPITGQCTSWKLPYDALKISTQQPENIIQIIELPRPRVSVNISALGDSGVISFNMNGRSLKPLSVRLQLGQYIRTLKLSRLGRIRIE